MTARLSLAAIAMATALSLPGCDSEQAPAGRSPSSYAPRTEGSTQTLSSHLRMLDKQYFDADHRDLDAFRADLKAYSDAVAATADAMLASKDTAPEFRRQAGEAKLNALLQRLEVEPSAIGRFLDAADQLEKEPAETGLPTLAASQRVKGLMEVDTFDAANDAAFDRLAQAIAHLGRLDPPNVDTIPLILQAAKAAESRRKVKTAQEFYTLLGERFPDRAEAKFAAGSLARLAKLSGELGEFSGLSLRDDNRVDVADYRGKVVLIDFWATWCAPCLEEVPALQSLRKKLGPRGFEIVGVCLDDTPDRARAGIKQYELDWPQIRNVVPPVPDSEPEPTLAMRFGVDEIPFKLVVDREGRLVATGAHLKDVEAAITAAIGPGEGKNGP